MLPCLLNWLLMRGLSVAVSKKSKEKQEIHSIVHNKANKIHIKGNCLSLEI